MSVITRRGDDGQTDFMFGRRCSKNSLRVHAYGEVDELSAALGMALALRVSAAVAELLEAVQERLAPLMGELATLPEDAAEYRRRGYATLRREDADWLERRAHFFESEVGIRFEGWVRPGRGASPGVAALELARTVCRRAERAVLALHEQQPLTNAAIPIFLNRLSDVLWLASRYESELSTVL